MDFALTDSGREAIADAAHVGLNKVTLVKMAVGDGRGAVGVSDSGRTTLRNERMRSALVGTDPGDARIAVRARFVGAPGISTWNVTEVGLIARIGDGGAEFLFAYGAAVPGADPTASIAAGVSTTVAAELAIVASSADINVTVDPDITVTGVSVEDLIGGIPVGSYLRVRDAGGGVKGLEARTAVQILQETTRRWFLPATSAGSLAAATIATVDNIPAGWTVTGQLTLRGSNGRAWWEAGSGVRIGPYLAKTTTGDSSTPSDLWQERSFNLVAPSGGLRLRADNNVRVVGGALRSFLVATAA